MLYKDMIVTESVKIGHVGHKVLLLFQASQVITFITDIPWP